MTREHIELGKIGEEMATRFLLNRGYNILQRNYKSKLGEIDIIARDKKIICFIEVKTRKTDSMGNPLESVNQKKQHQLSRVALSFLKSHLNVFQPCRFDIVSIILNEDKILEEVKLIKNAFCLDERYTY